MTSFLALARPFVDARVLTDAEVFAVALAAPRFGESSPEVLLGLAFVAGAARLGHVAVDLARAPEVWARALLQAEDRGILVDEKCSLAIPHASRAELGDPVACSAAQTAPASPQCLLDFSLFPTNDEPTWPGPIPRRGDFEEWHTRVLASPLVGEMGTPFTKYFAHGRWLLATHRRSAEEAEIAALLLERAALRHAVPSRLEEALRTRFGQDTAAPAARAARLTATRSLAVVTGGPGSGKTYSLALLLAAFLDGIQPGGAPLRILLAAPTGKAAARMREAVADAARALATDGALDDSLLRALQDLDATTLHGLLGIAHGRAPKFDREHPLEADVLVVDESSMVDLTLVRALLRATPLSTHLLFLGDPDQLASVDAGSVLADIVASDALRDHRVFFPANRRSGDAPTLAACVARLQCTRDAEHPLLVHRPSVNDAYAHRSDDEALARLRGELVDAGDSGRPDEPRFFPLGTGSHGGKTAGPALLDALAAPYRARFLRALLACDRAAPTPESIVGLLASLDDYRILAVHRRGPLGLEALEAATAHRVLDADFPERHFRRGRLRHGQALLVTANTRAVGLTNGDVGVALLIDGAMTCLFPGDTADTFRSVAPSRIPSFEGAFAMTVHKAQGSQFRHVAVVLAGRPSAIQTRELVYTALTRAKERVSWVGTEDELRAALGARVERVGTLRARLDDTRT